MRCSVHIAVVLFLSTAVGAAKAETIYSNFSMFPSNGSYYAVGGPSYPSHSEQGIRFTAGVTAALGSVEVAAFRYQNTSAAGNVTLYADSGSNTPGAVIETIPIFVTADEATSPTAVNSLLNPILNAGTTYWITLEATTSGIAWEVASQGGTRARRLDGVNWMIDTQSEAAVQLNALDPISPVPLPAAGWGGIALMGLLGAKRLRRKRDDTIS